MSLDFINPYLKIHPKFFIDQTKTLKKDKKEGEQPIIYELEERYRQFHVSPSDHIAYAFTWFSLSAWGLYSAKKFFKRNKRRIF